MLAATALLLLCASPVKIAASGFTVNSEDTARAGVWVERFAEVMRRDKRIEVTTASDIAQLLGVERQKQLMGCDSNTESCMAELASALGADGTLVGSITHTGDSYLAVVKVIRQKNGSVWWSVSGRMTGEPALHDWLDQQAQELGLRLSDATIAEEIRNDPAYRGADKKFSRSVFEDRIRQSGLSDAGYIRERRANELREQIIGSIAGGLAPSKTLIEIAHKFQEEKRTVAHFVLDPSKQPKIVDPDEAKLKEFYEQNKRQFVAPETRKINVLMLTREDVKERARIEDAEVRTAWEKSRESWNIPERRRIQQIAFKNREGRR